MHAQQGPQEAGKERGDAVMLQRGFHAGWRCVRGLVVLWVQFWEGERGPHVVNSADSPLTLTGGEEQASLLLL